MKRAAAEEEPASPWRSSAMEEPASKRRKLNNHTGTTSTTDDAAEAVWRQSWRQNLWRQNRYCSMRDDDDGDGEGHSGPAEEGHSDSAEEGRRDGTGTVCGSDWGGMGSDDDLFEPWEQQSVDAEAHAAAKEAHAEWRLAAAGEDEEGLSQFGSDADDGSNAIGSEAEQEADSVAEQEAGSEAEQEPEPTCLVWRGEVMAFMLRFLSGNYAREPTAFPQKLLCALNEAYTRHESRKARDPQCEAAERTVALQLCAQHKSDQIHAGRKLVCFRGLSGGRASKRGAGGGGGSGGGGGGDNGDNGGAGEEEEEDEKEPSHIGKCDECDDGCAVRVWQSTDG